MSSVKVVAYDKVAKVYITWLGSEEFTFPSLAELGEFLGISSWEHIHVEPKWW